MGQLDFDFEIVQCQPLKEEKKHKRAKRAKRAKIKGVLLIGKRKRKPEQMCFAFEKRICRKCFEWCYITTHECKKS